MKTKQLLGFLALLITAAAFAQTSTKDILGVWKMTDVEATDWYIFNFDTKTVTIGKAMTNLVGKEAVDKMKADMESKLEPTYFVFSDNNTCVSLQNDKLSKEDYKIIK